MLIDRFAARLTRELTHLRHPGGQFGLVGHENGQALLDREADRTAGADELSARRESEGASRSGIERTAELCEEGVVHAVVTVV